MVVGGGEGKGKGGTTKRGALRRQRRPPARRVHGDAILYKKRKVTGLGYMKPTGVFREENEVFVSVRETQWRWGGGRLQLLKGKFQVPKKYL